MEPEGSDAQVDQVDEAIDRDQAVSTLNPLAAEFRPRHTRREEDSQGSLVFGGGGHFLSKYDKGLRRRDGSSAPERVNVQLNQLIINAGQPERILQVIDENFEQLNVVNLITALHRLATICPASRKASLRRELRFRRLITRLSDTVRRADAGDLKPQDLSNVVWGLTKLNIQNQVLFGQLAERIVPRLSDFKPVNLSMSLWAFARAQIHDEPFLKAACEEVKRQLSDFEPQQVANTTWALAKSNHVDEELFLRAAEQALTSLDQYQPINFSMLVYSFALARRPHPELFQEVAKRCTVPALKHSSSAPHVVSNLVLAFTEAEIFIPELYDSVAEVALHVLQDFRPKQLVTLAESFSKAKVRNEALFRAMSRFAAKNIDDFQRDELEELCAAFDALKISKIEIDRASNQEPNFLNSSMLFAIAFLLLLTMIVWRI